MNLDWQRERFIHGEHGPFVFWLALRNLRDPESEDYFIPTLERLATIEECIQLIREAEEHIASWTHLLHPESYSIQLRKAKVDLLYKRIFDINSSKIEASLASSSTSRPPPLPIYHSDVPEPPPKRRKVITKIVFKGNTTWRPWPDEGPSTQ